MKPQRIQRKRTDGWRMPETAVYVGRGRGDYGKWGNPFKVSMQQGVSMYYMDGSLREEPVTAKEQKIAQADQAVNAFRLHLELGTPTIKFSTEDVRRELRGKDLACFCPLDQPCHADVLLEIANR